MSAGSFSQFHDMPAPLVPMRATPPSLVPSQAAPTRKLEWLQVLRALAASMVVFGHISGNARNRPDLFGHIPALHFVGGAGVDLFFLISGFIMVHTSTRFFGTATGSVEFLRRRLIRIVPLYWGATITLLILMRVRGPITLSPSAIVASFTFVPFNTNGRLDDLPFPILDLGWTLNYEMLFYIIFAIFIPLRKSLCVLAVAVTLGLLVVAGCLWPSQNVALHFWSQPITLEFVAGMGIALFVGHRHPVWPAYARGLLVLCSATMFVWDPMNLFALQVTPSDLSRLAGWGVPAVLMTLACTTAPPRAQGRAMRWGVLVGNASYALYLIHYFVIISLLHAAGHFAHGEGPVVWVPVALAFAFSIVIAVFFHRFAEEPLTRYLLKVTGSAGKAMHRQARD